MQWLIESDDQVELFEFVLQKIVRRHLAAQSAESRPTTVEFDTLEPLLRDGSVVLSALAHAGSRHPDEIAQAFWAGASHLASPTDGVHLLAPAECGLAQLDTALDRLAMAAPPIKKKMIEACVLIIGADGVIQERQAELLRAIADTLDCPIPPFVEGAENTPL